MKKFILYTAIFGKMGRGVHTPEVSIPDVDRICFTDLEIESDFYEIRKMKVDSHIDNKYEIEEAMIRRQRFVKICIPDEIFDNYEYSVYVDCKRNSVIDFEWLLSFMEPHSDFLTRRHKTRNCVYEEGRVCIKKERDDKATIRKQLTFYQEEYYPINNGLHYSYILLRRHTRRLKKFSRLWWRQLEQYSHRDQISLPYVAWKHNVIISICPRQ